MAEKRVKPASDYVRTARASEPCGPSAGHRACTRIPTQAGSGYDAAPERNIFYGYALALALHKADERMKSELEAGLSACAINFLQLSVLVALADGSASSPTGIARALNIDPAVVTRTLDKLEVRQLVYRVRGQKDRRSMHVSLTETGKATLNQISNQASKILSVRLKPFSKTESTRLYEHLTRLVD